MYTLSSHPWSQCGLRPCIQQDYRNLDEASVFVMHESDRTDVLSTPGANHRTPEARRYSRDRQHGRPTFYTALPGFDGSHRGIRSARLLRSLQTASHLYCVHAGNG